MEKCLAAVSMGKLVCFTMIYGIENGPLAPAFPALFEIIADECYNEISVYGLE